jgi:hypothetical protein
MDILFELYRLPAGRGVMWPPFMLILLKRTLDSGFIAVHQPNGQVIIGGMRTNPDTIVLTDKGRSFIDELGIHEL